MRRNMLHQRNSMLCRIEWNNVQNIFKIKIIEMSFTRQGILTHPRHQ
jgi:hypothetical protein